MPQYIFQKQYVGLDAPDLELIQRALHLLNGMDVAVGPHNHLHQLPHQDRNKTQDGLLESLGLCKIQAAAAELS